MKLLNRNFLGAGLVLIPSLAAICQEAKHDFSRWEPEIAAYEQRDATNPPPKSAVLFIGSSTIRLWKTLAQDFPDVPVINRGFGGSEIVDSTHFAGRIIFPYQPRQIFFRSGGNDLANGRPVGQVFADYQEFVTTVRAKLPEVEIVFIGWNPTPSRWRQHEKEQALNKLVEEFSNQNPRLKYLATYDMVLGRDGKPRPGLFMEDKLHFNTIGYKLLASRVQPFLQKD